MGVYENTFKWVQFPEGRARFSGGVRGIMDEKGHETFAVEVDGVEWFGEIDQKFLPNNNDFNVEVISFGYPTDGYIGMPMLGTCQIFTPAQIEMIQKLIMQLVDAGTRFEDKPSMLHEYPNARFMGEVFFRDGWALVMSEVMS
jgi:hypothetical protein